MIFLNTLESSTLLSAEKLISMIFLNFQTNKRFAKNHSKFFTKTFYHKVMPPKDKDNIANGEDFDQTAPLESF